MTAFPRVAYVLRAFPRLSETFILGEITALKRRGLDVRVIAIERIRTRTLQREAVSLLPEVAFVPQRLLPFRSGKGRRKLTSEDLNDSAAAMARWAAPLLRKWNAQHLHGHFAGPAAILACEASRITGIPFTFTAHAKDIFSHKADWRRLRPMARRAKAVVTVCDYNRRYLATRLPGARIRRIYNGVDLDRWRPASAPPRAGHVVAVGRMVPKKGFPDLVEAIGRLRRQGIPAVATIVGDGPERPRIEAAIASWGLNRHVRLAGGLAGSKVRRILRRAQVASLPCMVEPDGNQDALPTTLLEASACGIPVVASRVAGVPEIILDGRTGFVVPPEQPAALARALARILEHPVLRRKMGIAARQHMTELFNQKRSIEELCELFSPGAAPTARTRSNGRKRRGSGR